MNFKTTGTRHTGGFLFYNVTIQSPGLLRNRITHACMKKSGFVIIKVTRDAKLVPLGG
jgi:hypothetical protein